MTESGSTRALQPNGPAATKPLARSGRARRTSVIEKTLSGLSEALKTTVFSERIAARRGLLQGIDPRAKIAGIAALLVATSLAGNSIILLGLYVTTILLAGLSRIGLRFFIKRVWFFIPLFTGLIVVPSLFNVVSPGDPLLTIWDFGREVRLGSWSLGSSLAITRQGVSGATVLVLRVATSVSLAVLLALTTRWSELLKALRIFHVPRLFVLMLSMTYRYIFQIIGLAADMLAARKSRMVGPSRPRDDRRFVASSMGTLVGKSQSLSEEVHMAMLSRGYTGEPRTLDRFIIRRADVVFALAAVLVAVGAAGGDRLIGT